MKLMELKIQNVRGICDLSIKPEGQNFVVWGPNGSGKSAVVDAIDFLLTGQMSRLTGRGTGSITLGKHGSHIDHKPEEAIVRGVLQLPGKEDCVSLQRCVAAPSKLVCDKSMLPSLEPILRVAQRGQHVLTRREILKYITAEPSTRAEEIQTLLDVREVERIRRSLVRVKGNAERAVRSAVGEEAAAKSAIAATTELRQFREDATLEVANRNRGILGVDAISTLDSGELKSDLRPPTVVSDGKSINTTLLERDVGNVQDMLSEERHNEIVNADEKLRELLEVVRADPKLLEALERQELFKLGLTMIDETGACPLCGSDWPPGVLKTRLQAELAAAAVAARHSESIAEMTSRMMNPANTAIACLNRIAAVTESMEELAEEQKLLNCWVSELQELVDALSAPVEGYSDERFPREMVRQLLCPARATQALEHIVAVLKSRYPASTPEQDAWDTLTRLEENLKALESSRSAVRQCRSSYGMANALLEDFETSRDEVLSNLYDDVRDRFVELYRELHGSDEDGFTAVLQPDGAGLNLEVDFHNRGTHPPHALHSEGHQDSMGLCLYLALAEKLTSGMVDLVILDDVMMSVDEGHRRSLCSLLAGSFPNRQFLITTHDKTWANQLRHERVVSSKRSIEFFNWTIDGGPQVNCETGMWARIAQDLERNDVPGAAHKLRHGSETFFALVCDSLEARVRYKLTGGWSLGDYLPAAESRYKELVKKAKKAAQSWGDHERLEELQEIDSIRSQVFGRVNVEAWAVNANVHYNPWANFVKADFEGVVEAFQDLYGVFRCSRCGGPLYVAHQGQENVSVRCKCGKVNWNLKEKPRT